MWGLCPYCGKTDGCHSVGRDHWYVCHEHKTKWCIGSNLFSSWRDLTEDERRRNRRVFDEYRTVAPIMCGDWLKDAAAEAADPWSEFSLIVSATQLKASADNPPAPRRHQVA